MTILSTSIYTGQNLVICCCNQIKTFLFYIYDKMCILEYFIYIIIALTHSVSLCVSVCVCHFAYSSEAKSCTYLRFSQMIDTIVRWTQKFCGNPILKKKGHQRSKRHSRLRLALAQFVWLLSIISKHARFEIIPKSID